MRYNSGQLNPGREEEPFEGKGSTMHPLKKALGGVVCKSQTDMGWTGLPARTCPWDFRAVGEGRAQLVFKRNIQKRALPHHYRLLTTEAA